MDAHRIPLPLSTSNRDSHTAPSKRLSPQSIAHPAIAHRTSSSRAKSHTPRQVHIEPVRAKHLPHQRCPVPWYTPETPSTSPSTPYRTGTPSFGEVIQVSISQLDTNPNTNPGTSHPVSTEKDDTSILRTPSLNFITRSIQYFSTYQTRQLPVQFPVVITMTTLLPMTLRLQDDMSNLRDILEDHRNDLDCFDAIEKELTEEIQRLRKEVKELREQEVLETQALNSTVQQQASEIQALQQMVESLSQSVNSEPQLPSRPATLQSIESKLSQPATPVRPASLQPATLTAIPSPIQPPKPRHCNICNAFFPNGGALHRQLPFCMTDKTAKSKAARGYGCS